MCLLSGYCYHFSLLSSSEGGAGKKGTFIKLKDLFKIIWILIYFFSRRNSLDRYKPDVLINEKLKNKKLICT